MNHLVVRNRRVYRSRQRRSRSQWRDPAHDVPRCPLCIRRLGHRRALAAHRRRERLEVEAAADRHDGDDEAFVDAGQQGFEDAVGRQAECVGGFFAVRRRRRIVVVRAQLEGRSGAGQSNRRGRAAACGAILLGQLGLTAVRVSSTAGSEGSSRKTMASRRRIANSRRSRLVVSGSSSSRCLSRSSRIVAAATR